MHSISAVISRAALTALFGVSAANTLAFDSVDPFGTNAITPQPPLLIPASDSAFIPCAPPSEAMTYGVLEVVDRALCQNPQTLEAWANARIQAAQVGVAQSDYLPDLDARTAVNRVWNSTDTATQSSASLTLSWLLYDFGARDANLENARQLLSAAAATLDTTVQTVFLNAIQAYYNTQAARAAVTAAVESEKASRESLTAAEIRYKVGTGTPADRLQAQTAWSQATLIRIKAEGLVQTAYGTLANVMGLNANQPLTLTNIPEAPPDAALRPDVDALIDEARLRRPELKAAEAQIAAARSNVDSVRAAGLPSISLGTGPSWQSNRTGGNEITSHSNLIGLTLTVPLFSGFSTSYKIRAAQAKVDAANAHRDSARLQVALDVWTAYQNLTTANQTLSTSADLLASAKQSERVALGRYKAGVGTILDLLNAQSALVNARMQRIQSSLDWHVARASLARSVGTLDSRLLDPVSAPKAP